MKEWHVSIGWDKLSTVTFGDDLSHSFIFRSVYCVLDIVLDEKRQGSLLPAFALVVVGR